MLAPQLLLATMVLTTIVLPVASRLKDKCIDKKEDERIPHEYKTCHRFERLNDTTWPKIEDFQKSCGPGYYMYAQCLPCPLGYYKKNKKNKPCDLCGSGSGTPDESAEWCTRLCTAGSRLLKDGKKRKRICTECEIGFYQPYSNVDYNCVPCPHSMTTAKKGRTSIKDCFLNCPPGQHPNSNSTACVLCPEGSYKPDIGPTMCKNCSKNKTTAEDGATDSKQCTKRCEPGKEYNKTSGDCDIKCGRGTFKGEVSSRTRCRPCPENFAPNMRKAATACISNCGPGYEINDNKDNCTACGFGFFKTETGNLPCQPCPENQMTLTKASEDSGECQVFHECVKPLSQKLDFLFHEQQGLMSKSESFIDLMANTCRLGPNDTLVELLEEIVDSFQKCGVLGQIKLSDVKFGGKTYTKEHYLEIFRTAYEYGGICNFVLCLVDTTTEIRLSKSLIKDYEPCRFTDGHCFCSDAYRAVATSFLHYLQLCPALKFHPEFLEVNIGGTEMIESLLTAPNITTFCALSNGCDGVDCGHGSCSCLVSGGYQCRCRFGYTGEYCETAQIPTAETEPAVPTNSPSRDCEEPMEKPKCPTCKPCQECPEPTEPPKCPTTAPCPECPIPACLTREPCPECPKPKEPLKCPTPFPCTECPTQALPTSTPCPECPKLPDPPTCPTREPCPTCPTPSKPPACPTIAPCPNCPTLSDPLSFPQSTSCPVCPEQPATTSPTCATCPDCPKQPEPKPCPTTRPCPDCPKLPTPTTCLTCPSCQACPSTTEPVSCPTCASCPEPTPCPTGAKSKRSCLELLKDGNTQSGIYEIYVQSLGKHIEVYCDQYTDGGGWIVFQRRQDGSVDFYRDWNAYKEGFGQLTREFWLGLDIIHNLTTSINHDLRIDLKTFDSEKRFAEYSTIKIGSESSHYFLTADGYTGNAGDSFGKDSGRHNGQPFSTKDADHDASDSSCAQIYKGGWWYNSCHYSNLNGLYLNGGHESYADGIEWYHWRGYHYSLKFTEMKLREWHDWTGTQKPKSCLELLKQGNNRSGVYQIYVASMGRNVEVYCDQETDGGGWIVFQRRKDGSMDFYRNWNSYQFGFGKLEGEFWLGLDIIHKFTTSISSELRIDFQSFDYESRLAKYRMFAVGSESTHYLLTADGYTGNAGDSFGKGSGRHNGQPFSTKDADHDADDNSCAQLYKGGWWYKSCHYSNLNGLYLNGDHESYADGINWYHWRGYHYSLKFTEMKVREWHDWTGTRNPKSCLEWLKQGNSQSGIYQIYVAGLDRNIEVYCDQDSDGGGWIVFQRRQDGSMDFYRGWNSYQFGFGQLEGEFWLGLENLYYLSTSESCDLRIDLQDAAGEKRYAKYSSFAIGSDSSHYVLTADGYTGDAGDSFGKGSGEHNGQPFSTKDADHDASDSSCAQIYKGGWWYNSCHYSNLNGLYLNGDHDSYADGINWYHWKGYHHSLKFTEMKLREKSNN